MSLGHPVEQVPTLSTKHNCNQVAAVLQVDFILLQVDFLLLQLSLATKLQNLQPSCSFVVSGLHFVASKTHLVASKTHLVSSKTHLVATRCNPCKHSTMNEYIHPSLFCANTRVVYAYSHIFFVQILISYTDRCSFVTSGLRQVYLPQDEFPFICV